MGRVRPGSALPCRPVSPRTPRVAPCRPRRPVSPDTGQNGEKRGFRERQKWRFPACRPPNNMTVGSSQVYISPNFKSPPRGRSWGEMVTLYISRTGYFCEIFTGGSLTSPQKNTFPEKTRFWSAKLARSLTATRELCDAPGAKRGFDRTRTFPMPHMDRPRPITFIFLAVRGVCTVGVAHLGCTGRGAGRVVRGVPWN